MAINHQLQRQELTTQREVLSVFRLILICSQSLHGSLLAYRHAIVA